jgi:energy-coupling factor transporter ATP-binding protein EcfA2
MLPILPRIDQLSFWLGFILAVFLSLILFAIYKLQPQIKTAREAKLKSKTSSSFQSLYAALNKNTLRRCQASHLAGHLFPLSDIYVKIPVSAINPYIDPSVNLSDEPLVNHYLPFSPEISELASELPYSFISFEDVVKSNKFVVLTGEIGSGKTTLCSSFISDIIEHKEDLKYFRDFLPLILHLDEIDLQDINIENPIFPLTSSYQFSSININRSSSSKFLESYASTGNLLLVIDGLDEASFEIFKIFTQYLESLIKSYPNLRLIVNCGLYYLDGLESIGFTPYYIAPLSRKITQKLEEKWSTAWKIILQTNTKLKEIEPIKTDISGFWLDQSPSIHSIFFYSLKIWNYLSLEGDCSTQFGLISSYLDRIALTEKGKSILRTVAELIYHSEHNSVKTTDLLNSGFIKKMLNNPSDQQSEDDVALFMETLYETRILIERQTGYTNFSSPLLFGYLLSNPGVLDHNHTWTHYLKNPIAELTLRFTPDTDYILDWLTANDHPFFRNVCLSKNHIRKICNDEQFYKKHFQHLIKQLTNGQLPFLSRLRFLAAIIQCDNAAIEKLFLFLAKSPSIDNKLISAFGLGFCSTNGSISELSQLIKDTNLTIFYYSAISLSRIWNNSSKHILLDTFMSGTEIQKRLIAELLSTKGVECHELLKGFAKSKNILVRKSSLYGLRLIHEDWVNNILTDLSTADEEWVVRDAAIQILEENIHNPVLYKFQRVPVPSETTWLIELASKMGQGIPAGSIPYDLFMEIIGKGVSPESKNALKFIETYPNSNMLKFLHTMISHDIALREEAYITLSEISRKSLFN